MSQLVKSTMFKFRLQKWTDLHIQNQDLFIEMSLSLRENGAIWKINARQKYQIHSFRTLTKSFFFFIDKATWQIYQNGKNFLKSYFVLILWQFLRGCFMCKLYRLRESCKEGNLRTYLQRDHCSFFGPGASQASGDGEVDDNRRGGGT